MRRTPFVLVSLACAILFSYTAVSLSEERKPIQLFNTQAGGARPIMQALQVRSPIRSFSADLEVIKTCKPLEPIAVGQEATCTIIVRNLGPDPADHVTIVDKLISTGTFIVGDVTASEGSCTATVFTLLEQGGTVTCTVQSMAPNTNLTITLPVRANRPQDINDVVTVSGQPFDPIPGNNSASGVARVIGQSH